MKYISILFAILLHAIVAAQDTTVVQTLTFDSITTRRGWWEFPPASEQFRKVLMVHTLKCDPQTTQDQYPCGEWDYLTYHFIHEHTGALDSTALQHPFFKVGNSAPDTVRSVLPQAFHEHQRWERSATVTSVSGQTLATVGSADTTDSESFIPFTRRAQYLYTADELITAGLMAGPIQELRFHPLASSAALVDRCVIRMKNTTATGLVRFDDEGWTTVIDRHLTYDTLSIQLTTPFLWDGSSHVLVDIANEGWDTMLEIPIQASHVNPGTALREIGSDCAIRTDNDFIGVDALPLSTLDQAVTITFRSQGAQQLPLNTTFLEAVGASGERILNIHLPWGDGRVYWDAGSSGGAFDRIDKAANTVDYEGVWTDWAFVKNTATGSMKIYKNGALWHSGSGKVRPMSGIVRMRVASDANGGNPYPGIIDGLNIFQTEVDAATIAAWHDRKVTASHPFYSSLLFALEMDEGPFLGPPYLTNAVDPSNQGWLMGTVRREGTPATQLFRNPSDPGIRPVITFCQGDYTIALDSAITSFPPTDFLPQLSREIFAVQGNSVVPIDTLFEHSAGVTYLYAPDGSVIDSTFTGGALHTNDTLNYFGTPYEVVNDHEIGRYITPYGINLDLGEEGFSWVYDVTDYQHLLHDSVELSAGNQQELIDLSFLMIEGQAPRPVVNTQRPWGPMRGYSYASLDNDTELSSVNVVPHPDATQWMMRSRLTGHGHNSNDGNYPHCCEWKDNTHYLIANGQTVDTWHIWQENDCANNPVYPQGGTWLGSREGWCPGDLVKDRDTELTPHVQGSSFTIDYDITPVPVNNQGMGGGNYVVNMDLFEFGPASHALDAELYDVRRPNDVGYRSRENPICNDPVLVLRNAGSTPLTSVTFEYKVSGGQSEIHTWTGSLDQMERTEVILPVSTPQFWAGDEAHHFLVDIIGVNGGGSDGYSANDHYRTHFELPVIYPSNFILYYKTNARPQENDLFVRDINGDVVFSRTTFTANTLYKDTLNLPPGCYEVEFTDSGNDGLSYWADPDAGTGYFRFRAIGGGTLRNFISEFGHRIHAAFGIGTITGLQEIEKEPAFTIHPNPSNDRFMLTAKDLSEPAPYSVLNMEGRMIAQGAVLPWQTLQLDLGNEGQGVYVLRIAHDHTTTTLRLVKQ